MSQITNRKRVDRAIALLLFLVLACLALACSSKPTVANGRELFENKSKEGSFRLVSFKKTSGADAGQGSYTMEFEAVFECNLESKPGSLALIDIYDRCVFQCGGMATKGNLKGVMTFQKTDAGWKIAKCDWRP